MEADADVTVESPLSLDAQKIFFICTCGFPLAAAGSVAGSDCPFVLCRLSMTAGNLERSEETAQNDPIEKQGAPGPGRRHRPLVNLPEIELIGSYCISRAAVTRTILSVGAKTCFEESFQFEHHKKERREEVKSQRCELKHAVRSSPASREKTLQPLESLESRRKKKNPSDLREKSSALVRFDLYHRHLHAHPTYIGPDMTSHLRPSVTHGRCDTKKQQVNTNSGQSALF